MGYRRSVVKRRHFLAPLVFLAAASWRLAAQDGGNGPSEPPVLEAPRDLAACQVGYGDPSRIRVSWSNVESYEDVIVTVDGENPVRVDGAFGVAVAEASPGTREIAVQGTAGDIVSDEARVTFDVLADSPVVEPVTDLDCEFVPGAGGALALRWNEGADEWGVGEVRLGGRRGNVEFGPEGGETIVPLGGSRPDAVEVAFKNDEGYFSEPVTVPCVQRIPAFRRGDCDVDGRVNITDGIFMAVHLFQGAPRWICDDACDMDDDGSNGFSDILFLFTHLFRGSEMPPAPGLEECGVDPTEDFLGGLCREGCF